MAERPLRFLHASDLHLGQPLEGVGHVPTSQRELFRDAPYYATQRLCGIAISEQVDFVVLSGDVIDFDTAGSRGLAMLIEQFDRLNAAGIAVYWSSGASESSSPANVEVRWPANVKLFWSTTATEVVHRRRDGTTVAHLVGQARNLDGYVRAESFWPHATGLPSIAVSNGQLEVATVPARDIHYWALGGREAASTALDTSIVVRYPGTIQGRRPSQVGAFGATLVEWSAEGRFRATAVACDAARWCRIDLPIDPDTSRDQLQKLATQRLSQLTTVDAKIPLLVSWRVEGYGNLATQLRRGRLGPEMLGWLRSEFASRSPQVWSVALDVDVPAPREPDETDETLLGYFLRTTSRLATDHVELASYMDTTAGPDLQDAVRITDSNTQARVLRQAMLLGVDLLAGEEAGS